MKQTPQMQTIQAKMRPGVITLHGFLGSDTRNLVDMLVEDEAEVGRLGLTHQCIVERMRALREAGMRGLGDFTHVDPHFEVKVDSVRGKLPCPFGHRGMFAKINTTVRNLANGQEVVYTDLNMHMIEAHGFYEGKGSPFRTEPIQLAQTLEIQRAGDRVDRSGRQCQNR